AMAAAASTFTASAVFLPLVFVEGLAGQLIRDQALTISLSLLASLGVALTIVPILSAGRARAAGGAGGAGPGDKSDRGAVDGGAEAGGRLGAGGGRGRA